MNIIKIFFLLPSKSKFLQGFSDEKLRNMAESVWQNLNSLSPVLLIITALFGIGFAIFYYTGYNEMPGRHYKIRHWGCFAVVACVLSFFCTLAIEYFMIKTSLNAGVTPLYWLCALNNAAYCFILYFLTSFVWCNMCSTNAYKFLKIKR